MQEIVIKDYGGKILGYIKIDDKGNKTVFDFYKKIVGYYKKNLDITTDFYGRTIARGDMAAGLIGLYGNK